MADPIISLVVPVYHPVIVELQECIDSVQSQSYERWELCLALDGPQPRPNAEAVPTVVG